MAINDEFFLAAWKIRMVQVTIGACISLGTPAFAQVSVTQSSQEISTLVDGDSTGSRLPMPKILEGVKPGMIRESLIQLRKGVSGVGVERSDDLSLVEGIAGSPFIDKILYVYSESMPREVVLIAAMNKVNGAHIKKYVRGFVKGAVAIWGAGYSVHVSEMFPAKQRKYEAITLIWRISGNVVACTFPSASHITREDVGGFFVRITRGEEIIHHLRLKQ